MPPRQGRGRGHHHHHGGPGRGPGGPGPGPRRVVPGPFWFPFWGRPIGPGERLCWLCFWMSPPVPQPAVYEEHHHHYYEDETTAPAPVYSNPVIVEAFIPNPSSSQNGYRELYAIDYKQGDNPEKFYVQIPREATPGEFLECRLGNKQTRVLLPKDIGLGDTVIVVSKRS